MCVSCSRVSPRTSLARGELFAFIRRCFNSQSLFDAFSLPKGARRSRPLASSTSSRAAPRPKVAEGQPLTATLQPFGSPAGIETAIGADSMSKGRTMSVTSRSDRIRDLNDAFRATLEGGTSLFTAGVLGLGVPFATAALAKVRAFDQFTPGQRSLR